MRLAYISVGLSPETRVEAVNAAFRLSFRYVTLPCASHIQTSEGVVSTMTRNRFSLLAQTASAFRFRARCQSKARIRTT